MSLTRSCGEALSYDDVQAVHDAMDRFAVLVFHDQNISNDRQLAFSKQLGPIQPAVGNNVTPQEERRLSANFSKEEWGVVSVTRLLRL